MLRSEDSPLLRNTSAQTNRWQMRPHAVSKINQSINQSINQCNHKLGEKKSNDKIPKRGCQQPHNDTKTDHQIDQFGIQMVLLGNDP